MSTISNLVGRNDNCLAMAQQLSILKTSLNRYTTKLCMYSLFILSSKVGRYFLKKGKVHENNECHKVRVIFTELSLFQQIFPHINQKLIKQEPSLTDYAPQTGLFLGK